MATMDYAKEITSLRAQLQKESESRHILEDWINSSLKATLEKHQSELKRITVAYESKILALEEQLEKEIINRKKLTTWVKDHLGPNLEAEPFRDAVAAISARRIRSGSHTDSSHGTPTKAKRTATASRPPAKSSPSPVEPLDGNESPWSDERYDFYPLL